MPSDIFGIVGTTQAKVFSVKEAIAEGGFAVIYRAQHEGFRADVALKCLKVPRALSDEARTSFLEKFREEGELLFRLSAAIPAVVRPLHFGVLENATIAFVPFMALEWLDGETLDRLVQKRAEQGKAALGLERSVRLLGPIARALERAHRFPSERGTVSILHRDLKPENVFVAQVGREQVVKILDFGIGKVKSAATQIVGKASLDGDAISAFTPAYGAPEQWLPKRFGQTGTWTDVWGWALTVIEAVIGRTPLDGDAAAIMGAVLDPSARPTPKNLGVETSADVDRVFARALAIDPRDRYQDVGEFWDDLERLLGFHTPRIERTVSPLESLPPPGALPELALPDFAKEKREQRAQAATVAFVDASREAVSDSLPPADALTLSDSFATTDALPFTGSLPLSDSFAMGDSLSLAEPEPSRPLASAPSAASTHDTDFLQRGSNWQQVGDAQPSAGVLEQSSGALPEVAESGPKLDAPPRLEAASKLEGVGITPGVVSTTNRRFAPAPTSQTLRPGQAASAIVARLWGPLKLFGVAVVLAIAAWMYFVVTGELLRIGPVGPFWLAGPLMIVSFVWMIVALFRDPKD